MRSFTSGAFAKLAVFLTLTLSTLVSAVADVAVEKGVYVLTDANFKTFLAENENVLVEFYAPWCGHCKNLEPEYATAAEALVGKNVKLAKIDATEHTKTTDEYKIKGFPTMNFFSNGELSAAYDSARTSTAIVAWLEKRISPMPVVDTVSDIAALLEANKVVGVAYVADAANAEAVAIKKAYSAVTFPLVLTTSEQVIAEVEKLTGTASTAAQRVVLINKQLAAPKISFTGDLTSHADVTAFLINNSHPVVFEFNSETSPTLFGAPQEKRHFVFTFGDLKNPEYKSAYDCVHTLAMAAREAKEATNSPFFVHIDAKNPESAGVYDYFGLSKDVVAQTVIFDIRNKDAKKYRVADNASCEELKASLAQYLNGALTPFLKSEPVPENWDAKPVKVLVGNSFNKVVNGTKHAFVEFYAPWCGHCQSLAPIWEELAVKFASNDQIVVANFDATKNEVADVDVSGFPTLIYFGVAADFNTAANQEVYSGARDIDALTAWIESKVGGAAAAADATHATGHHDEL